MSCCAKAGRPSKTTRCYLDPAAPKRVFTFESAAIIANPLNLGYSNVVNVHNGDYSGLAAMTIVVPAGAADSQHVLDLWFVLPRDGVTDVRITTNFGGNLSDFDNIDNPNAQLFDAAGAPLTPVFVASAANGGGFFVTPVPGGPLNGVSRLRITNLHNNAGVAGVGIREIELLGLGIAPAMLVYQCCDASPLHWEDARTGVTIDPLLLTSCR